MNPEEDASRGARYNSAIRYITFIVIVSEDGYVNCFFTKPCMKN